MRASEAIPEWGTFPQAVIAVSSRAPTQAGATSLTLGKRRWRFPGYHSRLLDQITHTRLAPGVSLHAALSVRTDHRGLGG